MWFDKRDSVMDTELGSMLVGPSRCPGERCPVHTRNGRDSDGVILALIRMCISALHAHWMCIFRFLTGRMCIFYSQNRTTDHARRLRCLALRSGAGCQGGRRPRTLRTRAGDQGHTEVVHVRELEEVTVHVLRPCDGATRNIWAQDKIAQI